MCVQLAKHKFGDKTSERVRWGMDERWSDVAWRLLLHQAQRHR